MTMRLHPNVADPADIGIPMAESFFTDADRLVLAMALDALDQCLEYAAHRVELTQEMLDMFSAVHRRSVTIVEGIPS